MRYMCALLIYFAAAVASTAGAQPYPGAVRKVVGIRCGAISDNTRVSFQAARSIG